MLGIVWRSNAALASATSSRPAFSPGEGDPVQPCGVVDAAIWTAWFESWTVLGVKEKGPLIIAPVASGNPCVFLAWFSVR